MVSDLSWNSYRTRELSRTLADVNCSAEERFNAFTEMISIVSQLFCGDLEEVIKTERYGEGSILGMIEELTNSLKNVTSERNRLDKAKMLLEHGGLDDSQKQELVKAICWDLIPSEKAIQKPKAQSVPLDNNTEMQITTFKSYDKVVPVLQNPTKR